MIGNVTRTPEIYTTQGGIKKANFTLAVQRQFANAQGVKEADFIPCVAWRQTAELVEKYVDKGKKLAVKGTLQVRKYEADGATKTIAEVVIELLEFLGARTDKVNEKPSEAEEERPTEMIPAESDDLPF